jgi:hypothetical protein
MAEFMALSLDAARRYGCREALAIGRGEII